MVELNLQAGSNELFLINSKEKRSYKELIEQTNRMYEALLIYASHTENNVILVQISDRFHLACVIFALGRMGATYLLVNPKWSTGEIDTVLNHTLSKLIISDNAELSALTERNIQVVSPTDLGKAESKETISNTISLSGEVLMCTTGTTGEPKIVARTWDAIFNEVDAVIERLHYTQAERIFCLAQWTHSLGFVIHFLAGVRARARLITMPELSTPSIWIRTMQREEITIVVGVPTFYSFLVQAPELELNLKMGISAGAALPKDIFENFSEKFGAPLLQFYGCTEAGAITMQSLENETPFPSLGKALGNMQIRVVDEDGQPVKQGEIGFIRIKSDALAHEILEKGTFIPMEAEYATGDQGMFTEEGNLIVVGRNKQRIKINGLGLHLGEVEKVLQKHTDIVEAAVAAETDVRRGSVLVAYIRTGKRQPSEIEIRNFCMEHLATYKIPHKFIFVKEFNRDAKGQIKLLQ